MNRIDRLTAILIQLQSKRVVTAREVADRFDISLRTVYRDIRALEEGGVPIGAEAGKGYFIPEGYYLPPVMFKPEEAHALVLGAKLIAGQTDHSIRRHFNDAMLKIKSVLKSQEKEELERLESQIEVAGLPQPESKDFPNNFLSVIQTALIHQSVLRFNYFSNYTGDFNTRDAEPLGLIFYGNRWHLLAYCRLRQGLRDFRVDRIVRLEVLDERFNAEKRKPFKEFLDDLLRGTDLEEVEISVDKTIARHISEQKYHHGFVSQRALKDRVFMTFLVLKKCYFSKWLLTLGNTVEIISPPSLKAMVLENIEELSDHYRR